MLQFNDRVSGLENTVRRSNLHQVIRDFGFLWLGGLVLVKQSGCGTMSQSGIRGILSICITTRLCE